MTTLIERAINAVRVAGKHDAAPDVAGSLVHVADELEAENLHWTDVERLLRFALNRAGSAAEREKIEKALKLTRTVVEEQRSAEKLARMTAWTPPPTPKVEPSQPPLTRQGVRNLDEALGPRRSQGTRLPPAPKQNSLMKCPHRLTYKVNELYDHCEDCSVLVFSGTEEDAFYAFEHTGGDGR